MIVVKEAYDELLSTIKEKVKGWLYRLPFLLFSKIEKYLKERKKGKTKNQIEESPLCFACADHSPTFSRSLMRSK